MPDEPRIIGRPEPGFWLIRLVKHGPWVPACIQHERTTHEPGEESNEMDRSAILTARINGEIVPLERVWETRGRRIGKQEHDHLVAVTNWSIEHAPDQPAANPAEKIDPLKVPSPF